MTSAHESTGSSPWRWFVPALLALLIDQGSKWIIGQWLPLGYQVEVTAYFNLVHVLNPGAAFSFLAGAGGWQRYFFIVLGVAVAIYLGVMLYRGDANRWEALGYSLVLGGALGNVTDRLFGGAVVDFLDFHVSGWHWPAFNVADIAINAGVALLLWATFTDRQPNALEQRQ
jgi:signal peptidase II